MFFVVLAWDVASDYTKWLKHRAVIHGKEAWVRAILLAPSCYYMSTDLPLQWYWGLSISAFAEASMWWLLFDGLYNVFRGYNWWFTGSVDPDDASTDTFLRKLKKWQHIALKFALIATSLAAYMFAYFLKS